MEQYINKSEVVAEINKRITDAPIDCYGHQRVWAYNDVKNIIDDLGAKEVDLEKEIKNYLDEQPIVARSQGIDYKLVPSPETIAKHFFELGLKAQKGE